MEHQPAPAGPAGDRSDRPEETASHGLLVWGLATFHASVFVLLLVVLLFQAGSVGGLLASLNTLLGFAVFGVLWAISWLTARRALRGVSWAAPSRRPTLATSVGRGVLWGGLNGALFLLALLAVALVAVLALALARQVAGVPTGLSSTLAIGLVLVGAGLPIAFVIGALVGAVFAIADYGLLELAHRMVPASQGTAAEATLSGG